jgi:nucleoside-diphosphate-sugar epimerase
MKKILVTGANGFVGRNLVRHLVAQGHDVRALVLPQEVVPAQWSDSVEIVRGDVTVLDSVHAAMQERDVVFHLAAVVSEHERKRLYRQVTIEGTRHVLESAAQSGAHAILLSSVTVYGNYLDGEQCDEDHELGIAQGHYGRSKQAQEAIARELAAAKQLKVTTLRAGCVFGVGSSLWVDTFVSLLRRRMPSVVGDGHQVAGLCFVENLVALMLLTLQPQAVGRIYNVNDGDNVSWWRYVCDLACILDAPPPLAVPRSMAKFFACSNDFWKNIFPVKSKMMITRESYNLLTAHQQVSIERAKRELGFSPPVSYEMAMRQIAKHLSDG